MQNIAALSGATLGYIVGNLPGSYIGYKLGKMAPIRRARSRYSSAPYPTPRSARYRKTLSYGSRSTVSGSRMGSMYSALSGGSALNSVVTRQHDFQGQYKYKKMPRYKKRRWRRFVKKVAAVQLKQAGLKTVLFNSRDTYTNTAGTQNSFCLALYGLSGTIDNSGAWPVLGMNDMYRIFKNDPDIIQTGAAPGNVPKSGKLQFGSGVLDFTIRNLSDTIEAELDIYYGWFKKDDDPADVKNNTNPIYKYQTAAVDLVAGGNSQINLGVRGATLFDKPSGLSQTGYHITKKTKMLLAPGQSTFLQHRDPKNHMLDWVNIQDRGYAKRGLTFGAWVVFKPSVTASDDAVVTLGVGCTRKYSYAVVEDNVDRIAYNPPN